MNRHKTLAWERLQILQHNLDLLASDFTESKIKSAIDQMPSDKVPSPDGCTCLFHRMLGDCQRGCNERDQCFPPTMHIQFISTQQMWC